MYVKLTDQFVCIKTCITDYILTTTNIKLKHDDDGLINKNIIF
jgi:hypothetical protein